MKDTLTKAHADRDKEIGHRIREFRKIRGYSQERLATSLGITFQQVQKYEKGTNRIAATTLIAICTELKLNPMDVIGMYFGEIDHHSNLIESVVDENRRLRAQLAKIRSAASVPAQDFGLEADHAAAMPRRGWPTGAAEIITQ